MNLWSNDWVNVFTNIGRTVGANSGTNCWTNIFATGCVDIFPDFRVDFFTNARRNFSALRFLPANFWTNRNGGERIAAKNIGRYLGAKNRLRWRTNSGTLRQNGRGESRSREREMERFRLFRFQRLQFRLLAKLTGDFAERSLRSFGICVETRRWIRRSSGRAIIFLSAFVSLGFDLCAVFGRQDVQMLEIFLRVNVLGAFL